MNQPGNEHEVDAAWEALRSDRTLRAPDPALESRVRAAHRLQIARVRAPTLRRPLLAAAAVACAAGVAWTATSGHEWLRGWWAEIRLDGEVVEPTVTPNGDLHYRSTLSDGTEVEVTVRRGDGGEVGIEVVRESPGGFDEDVVEFTPVPDPPMRRFLPSTQFADSVPVHVWQSSRGRTYALILEPRAERIAAYAQHLDRPETECVQYLGEFVHLPGAKYEVTLAEGTLGVGVQLEARGARGEEFAAEWILLDAEPAEQGEASFVSPDGRVRVRTSSDPRPPTR